LHSEFLSESWSMLFGGDIFAQKLDEFPFGAPDSSSALNTILRRFQVVHGGGAFGAVADCSLTGSCARPEVWFSN